jgi:hypothetical protein
MWQKTICKELPPVRRIACQPPFETLQPAPALHPVYRLRRLAVREPGAVKQTNGASEAASSAAAS